MYHNLRSCQIIFFCHNFMFCFFLIFVFNWWCTFTHRHDILAQDMWTFECRKCESLSAEFSFTIKTVSWCWLFFWLTTIVIQESSEVSLYIDFLVHKEKNISRFNFSVVHSGIRHLFYFSSVFVISISKMFDVVPSVWLLWVHLYSAYLRLFTE